MESSEMREPSYYEIALTNRQVVIAFVVVLATLLGAFLSGVWIGRDSGVRRAVATPQPAPAEPAEPPAEQLTFFSQKAPAAKTRPAAAPAATEDAETETMRRTLEAEMAASRETPEAAPAQVAAAPAPDEPPATPGSRRRQRPAAEPAAEPAPAAPAPAPTPKPAAKPAPAASPAPAESAGTWVQVYSSTNGERAREIAAQLRRAGFPVVVAELPIGGDTNWRVRVGPYDTREKAEQAATRLRREQSLDTWVTSAP
ncbi:MAG TPA: SPOR domain-containing protein [Thermoanaerobaculia bacterium]|nr:SPOR domain-containing protein [Thermoanaerobaculia bacterium]